MKWRYSLNRSHVRVAAAQQLDDKHAAASEPSVIQSRGFYSTRLSRNSSNIISLHFKNSARRPLENIDDLVNIRCVEVLKAQYVFVKYIILQKGLKVLILTDKNISSDPDSHC